MSLSSKWVGSTFFEFCWMLDLALKNHFVGQMIGGGERKGENVVRSGGEEWRKGTLISPHVLFF